MKTPEEMAEEYTKDWWANLPEAEGMRQSARENFLAGYKAGREMSEREIFDHYMELRKKNGDKEPATHYERFKISLKGIF
jgi:hypothetical protein